MCVWFNDFTFCYTFRSKFCELTWGNVRVWFSVFTSSIFSHLISSSQRASPKSS
ncbi:hypothetical protein HanRHA438_Chr13g0590381 [Helianthus annuus]|nr:hypothetical protein HanRHA438_Chr13g0590381 [Helianthus annuus]